MGIFRRSRTRTVSVGSDNAPPERTPWSRPAEWLDMTVAENDDKVQILYQVWDGFDNRISGYMTTDVADTSQYTVDWGDGSTDDYASGALYSHAFDFATIGAETTLPNGARQVLITITPKGGDSLLRMTHLGEYWATVGDYNMQQQQTAYHHQLQMDISMPNANGPCDLSRTYNADFAAPVAMEYIKIWDFGHGTLPDEAFAHFRGLRRLDLPSVMTGPTSLDAWFAGCWQLDEINGDTSFPNANFDQPNVFTLCYDLSKGPNWQLGSGATILGGFFSGVEMEENMMDLSSATSIIISQSAVKLKRINWASIVPANITAFSCSAPNMEYDDAVMAQIIPNLTTANNLYYGRLSHVGEVSIDLTGKTEADYCFAFNYNMTKCTVTVDSSFRGARGMFQNCEYLEEVVFIGDTSNIDDTYFMFHDCYRLKTVTGLEDLSKVTDCQNMYERCRTMEVAPTHVFGTALTTARTMFSYAECLRDASGLDFSACVNCTTYNNSFFNCDALRELNVNMAGVTSYNNALAFASGGARAIEKATFTGLRFGTALRNTNMKGSALDAFYTALGTASGTQTIYITSSAGVGTDDPTIATGKGFTVSG